SCAVTRWISTKRRRVPGDLRRHEVRSYSRRVTDTRSKRLYGPQQSRFARHLEERERKRPDPVARELRHRLLAGLCGRVLEVGCGDGRSFEHYPASVTQLVSVEPDPTAHAPAAAPPPPAPHTLH